ncbi:hypothetical protein SAMN02745223_03214 [Devosia limi DSM 17137]|uniref:Uncharacterized protein n=1 Tax=Devosia limi DSM 17137 TaxID=1121477 RepID=A0A1M5DFT9_9HYPH|nr:hypothetical protein SAMN02745223_03214 [Devosia limi DSM 17137]
MAGITIAQLLSAVHIPISILTQRVLLLLPCSCCVPSLWGSALQNYGFALPSSEAIFFCPNACAPGHSDPIYACNTRMADMLTSQLLTQSVEIILRLSLRRTRILLPRFLYRDTRTWIVSSSLDPCSTGRAHILLPCSLPHFRFGFGPIIRLHLRMEPFFCHCRRLPWWVSGHNVAVSAAWLAYQLRHC